jgi:hypothetical protein
LTDVIQWSSTIVYRGYPEGIFLTHCQSMYFFIKTSSVGVMNITGIVSGIILDCILGNGCCSFRIDLRSLKKHLTSSPLLEIITIEY